MGPSLQSLPAELLDAVSFFCTAENDRKTLLHLRATYHDLRAGAQSLWLQKYFSLRKLSFTAKKIFELRVLSSRPELAEAVKTIEIVCEDDPELFDFDQMSNASSISAFTKYLPLLTLAFENLKNLKNVKFSPLQRNQAGDNVRNEHRIIDCSDTFVVTMFALQACDIRPTSICGTDHDVEGFDFGIIPSRTLPQLQYCFSELKVLDLSFPELKAKQERHVDALDVAMQFSTALSRMSNLTELNLGLIKSARGGEMIGKMAETVFLPCLKKVLIQDPRCSTEMLERFLVKHAGTLRSCTLGNIQSSAHGRREPLRKFLYGLRDGLELNELIVFEIRDRCGKFDFPGVDCPLFFAHPNEPEYIEVGTTMVVHFCTRKAVMEGLSTMIDCMRRIARV